jgi:succinate dehydrogenase / fumarate reductase flavoprotein subunit
VQAALQEMMQDLVGIVRREEEMQRAVQGLAALRERAARAGVGGHREYNPGWHTALDLANLLTVAEAVTRAALVRRESRGAHFRDDAPGKVEAFGKVNHVVRKGPDGAMQVQPAPVPPLREDLAQVVKEMG